MSTVNLPVFRNGIYTTTPVALYAVPAFAKIRMEYNAADYGDVLRQFVNAVCEIMQVTEKQLLGPGRKAELVRARMYIWLLMRQYTLITQPELGRRFNRDHTTILHGVRIIQDRIRLEDTVAHEFHTICHKLGLGHLPKQ